MDLIKSSIKDIVNSVKGKKISAVEVVDFYLTKIQQINPTINAYVEINQKASQQAAAVDEKIQKREAVGELAGLPIAVKDLFCTEGIKTTAASKMLGNFIPPYTATCIERLYQQGAICLGKTNMDEFAMGSSNEMSYYGVCKNPWKHEYVPGGSSGGSAAAVASHMAPVSIGSDTGGSIRQPAHFCGLVGVKPTYGRISRYGMIAFASSLDQAGPMTKTVEDSIYLLNVMCGADPKDMTTSQKKWQRLEKQQLPNAKKIKVGLPKEYLSDDLNDTIKSSFTDSVSKLKQSGIEFVDISLPNLEYAVPTYYMVASSEASSNLSRYDGVRYGYRAESPDGKWSSLDELYSKTRGEGFGKEVKRRILLGAFALSSGYYDAYYLKASQVRRVIQNDFLEAFKKCDVILSPVANSTAFPIGDRIEDPVQMYLNDIYTTSANLAGLPAMSLPVGMSTEGLPIGIQIMAPHFREDFMLSMATFIEEVSEFQFRGADV